MPYIRKGKCVYKKDTGKKVGCSKSISRAKKYLKALHINVNEEFQFDKEVNRALRMYS